MAFSFKNFWNGLRLVPNSTNTTSQKGDLQVTTSDSRLNFHDGSNSSPVVTQISNDEGSARLQNKDLSHNSVAFVNPSDTTKKIAFSAVGSPSTITTLQSSQTANRILILPDENGTLSTQSGSETISNKTFTSDTMDVSLNTVTNIANTNISSSAAIARSKLANGPANAVIIDDGSGVMSSETFLAKSRGGSNQDNSSITFPASGTLVTETGTETLSNKTISTTNNVIGSGPASNGQVLTADGASGSSWTSIMGSNSNVITKSANYTLTTSDDVILVDTTGAPFTLQLPASTGSGHSYKVVVIGTASNNECIIQRAGGDVVYDNAGAQTSTSVVSLSEEIEILDATTGNWRVTSRRIPSVWQSIPLTPDATAFGTITNGNYLGRRVGDSFEISFYFKAGTTTANPAFINLPPNIVIDSSKVQVSQNNMLGMFFSTEAVGSQNFFTSGSGGIIYYNSASTSAIYISNQDAADGSSTLITNVNATSILNTGGKIGGRFVIPVVGWNG